MTDDSPTPRPVPRDRDGPDGPDRPTRVRWQVTAFLCVLAFMTYFDRVCIMRAQGDIQRDLGLTDYQVG